MKDLQTQNAQFQQMFLDMAKGQEDLKTLLLTDKKKKSKKSVGVLNLERRLKGPVKRTLDLSTLSTEGDNQTKEGDNNWGLMKMMLTSLRNNILLLMINTNSWRIASMLWRFSRYLAWTLKS